MQATSCVISSRSQHRPYTQNPTDFSRMSQHLSCDAAAAARYTVHTHPAERLRHGCWHCRSGGATLHQPPRTRQRAAGARARDLQLHRRGVGVRRRLLLRREAVLRQRGCAADVHGAPRLGGCAQVFCKFGRSAASADDGPKNSAEITQSHNFQARINQFRLRSDPAL